jgi:AcrR family transcriptional regulator
VEADDSHWQQRVVGRSLQDARRRSIDRGARLVQAAARVLERNRGESLTVQEVADEAGQSLKTLYQYFASKDDLLLAVHEEAMRTWARMIRASIAGIDDPVERLAGSLLASGRAGSLHDTEGIDRGLSRLRLQLTQADPALLARSQEPVTTVDRELVAAALAAEPGPFGVDEAVWLVANARRAFIQASTVGDDLGVDLPDLLGLSMFCLTGIGLDRQRAWHEAVEAKLDPLGEDRRSILRRLAQEPG